MLFAYRIKKDFSITQKKFFENVKLKEFIIDVLVETSPYLDKSSQSFGVYFKIPTSNEFVKSNEFIENIRTSNLKNADNIGNYFVVMKFLLEIENKIVNILLEFKDLFYKFKTYRDNIYNDKEVSKLVNLAFVSEVNKKLKYNYISGEYTYDDETFIKEIDLSDEIKEKFKTVSIYDIQLNITNIVGRKNKFKFYLTSDFETVYIVEKIIDDDELGDTFALLGKSFKLKEIEEFIEENEVRYGTFRFLYNTIDECKQSFIRSIAQNRNLWVLFSGKVIELPKKITDDPTNMANALTTEMNSFVSTKDIFALANKIESPNYAVEEFKKFLLMKGN